MLIIGRHLKVMAKQQSILFIFQILNNMIENFNNMILFPFSIGNWYCIAHRFSLSQFNLTINSLLTGQQTKYRVSLEETGRYRLQIDGEPDFPALWDLIAYYQDGSKWLKLKTPIFNSHCRGQACELSLYVSL